MEVKILSENEEDLRFKKDLQQVEENYEMLTNIEAKLKSYLSGDTDAQKLKKENPQLLN